MTHHPSSPPATLQQLLSAEPDLVDRIFEYVLTVLPELAQEPAMLDQAKTAVREEFAGARIYVRKSEPDLAGRILALYNGRNASQVARELGISRATVYRKLKQPGPEGSSQA